MGRYRILSLDGGGAWALIEVMALIDLFGETTTGHEVLKQFDLAAANSGGSIVLGGLVEDLPLSELKNFFLDEAKRKSIFVRKELHLPGFEKYDTPGKLTGLRAAFPKCGDRLLSEVAADIPGRSGKPVHLLIAGFDYDRNRGAFFRSAPATREGWGSGASGTATLAEAIHASSNAPIRYFDGPAILPTQKGKRYWDGAISGSNNPVLIGVTEAVVLGQSPLNLVALSIGTGSVFLPFAPEDAFPEVFYSTTEPSGLLPDVQKITGAILDDPPDMSSFTAHVMTGGPPPGSDPEKGSCIIRMSPMVSPVLDGDHQFVLPEGLDEDAFRTLVNMDMDAVIQDQVIRIESFAGLWLQGKVANQPVRMAPDLTPEIGQRSFAEARDEWRRLVE